MRGGGGAAAILAGFALLAAVPAAAAGKGPPPPQPATELARLEAEAEGPVQVARHAGSGRIKSLKGRLSPPGEGPPEATAGRFLRKRAALLGLQEDLGDLTLAALRGGPATQLDYRQTSGSLPVFNGGVDVTLDREGRVFFVNNRYVPTHGLDLEPILSAAEGIAAATADLPRGAPGASRQPQLGVFLEGEAPRLAWRLVLEASAPFALVEYTVDARTGAILQRRSLVQELSRDGWGQVFSPNPVNTLKNAALADGADADGEPFAAAYLKAPLRGLDYKEATGEYFLAGPYVSVSDAIEPPFLLQAASGVASSTTGAFRFGREAEEFEHVMCYQHIDANQRYIQGLGFQSVNRRPIRVDPHGLAAGGGSRYVADPLGAGYLVFSSGGVDDAEDADVILHEYAHALQDNQAPGRYLGGGAEAAAMAEGFADYWAASSTYDLSVANGFDPACVGEWDAAPGCLGRVDGTKHYPEDVTGNADRDAEIWSGALWELFANTGDRGATDSIVLQSHFLVPDNPKFADGVNALLAADELLFEGAHQGQICSVMAARGLRSGDCGFTAIVSWNNIGVDLDLHLRPPGGANYPEWDYEFDCSYQYVDKYKRDPDWGIQGSLSDDPVLKNDCRYDCTQEQIVLKKFTTPGIYRVLVHFFEYDWHYSDHRAQAVVRVYQGATKLFEGTRELHNESNYPETGDLWEAFRFEIAP